MEIPGPSSVAATLVIASIAVLWGMFLAGRVKSKLEAVLASAVIIGAGVWLHQAEAKANAEAEALVGRLFDLSSDTVPLVFQQHSSRGTRVARIEAIYELSPGEFASQDSALSLDQVSFRYRKSEWSAVTVDRFEIAPGAVDWQELPRRYSTANYYHVERGHYSRQRTPNERDMSGKYVCAFIPIDVEADRSVETYEALPCRSVGRRRPGGITILGLLNRNDRTLHVLIQ